MTGTKHIIFSMASFHNLPLIAKGLEDGRLLIQETTNADSFSKPYLSIKAHSNAIMDLDVSPDDTMIATGSGDKVAKIIDVETRKKKAKFLTSEQDGGTIKQVRFQPGNPHVVATSCREGIVNIWDMRCHGEAMVTDFVGSVPKRPGPLSLSNKEIVQSCYKTPISSIRNPHGDRHSLKATGSNVLFDAEKEHITRHTKISVTSMAFLPGGRDHLIVTGCDASASIRLWDLRARYSLNRRSGALPVPVSTTAVPSNHATHRSFGLTSLAFNNEGSRLYAVARDNVVYAYSTGHLILGHAPELDMSRLSLSSKASPRFLSESQSGIGPLYGIRNKNLHVGSFYVKAAVRPISSHCRKPELLAIGSTSACTVLIPTEERLLLSSERAKKRELNRQHFHSDRLRNGDEDAMSDADTEIDDGEDDYSDPTRTPIYEAGTVLVNGHEKEVSAVAWTCNGDLVTSADDKVSRCWRENPAMARECRKKGLRDAMVSRSGWADAKDEEDELD
jgi:WD40 repeat protein